MQRELKKKREQGNKVTHRWCKSHSFLSFHFTTSLSFDCTLEICAVLFERRKRKGCSVVGFFLREKGGSWKLFFLFLVGEEEK